MLPCHAAGRRAELEGGKADKGKWDYRVVGLINIACVELLLFCCMYEQYPCLEMYK